MGSCLMDYTRAGGGGGLQRVYMQPVEGSYRGGSIRYSSATGHLCAGYKIILYTIYIYIYIIEMLAKMINNN